MYKASELELNKLLGVVLERGASDLHMVAGEPPVIRVDGSLQRLDGYDVLTLEAIQGILDILLSPARKALFETQEDIDLAYTYKDSARFRINAYRQKGLLGMAFRLIPNDIKNIKELNLPDKLLELTNHKEGLVLVVGPTGHGKSTTLASLIDYINHQRPEHILTIEDPIEFIFKPDKSIINQREIFVDSPSFGQALKSSLRQDANVILVGEMRDYESVSSVMTIAETGHLVFATLHTNDAAQTIDRIIDVFPPYQHDQIKQQLASVLIGIISIRLMPKIGGGRVPAVEILLSNNAIKNVIREGKTYSIPNVLQTNIEEGMTPMDRALAVIVKQGLASYESALEYVKDPQYFNSLLGR